MRILITGSRAPIALDLARKFHQAGHQVWLADSLKNSLSNYSNVVEKSFHLPRPVQEIKAFRQAIDKIVRDLRIDRVIPTCEEIFFFDEPLTQAKIAFRDSIATLQRIHHKKIFADIAAEHRTESVSSPRTHLITSPEDLTKYSANAVDFVFKPAYSRFASRTLIGPSYERLVQLACPTPVQPWVAQQRIFGTEYSTYSVAHQGKLTAHACYFSLYKAGQGSGIYFLPRNDTRIEAFVSQLLAKLGFTGQLGLDLIEDQQGKLWVLEGNPRGTSGIHLFSDLDLLPAALLDPRTPIVRPSSPQPVAVSFAMPFWGFADAIRRKRGIVFFKDWWQARDPMFRWNDLGPCFGIVMAFAELLKIRAREKKSLMEASTFDIEWNGEALP